MPARGLCLPTRRGHPAHSPGFAPGVVSILIAPEWTRRAQRPTQVKRLGWQKMATGRPFSEGLGKPSSVLRCQSGRGSSSARAHGPPWARRPGRSRVHHPAGGHPPTMVTGPTGSGAERRLRAPTRSMGASRRGVAGTWMQQPIPPPPIARAHGPPWARTPGRSASITRLADRPARVQHDDGRPASRRCTSLHVPCSDARRASSSQH